MVGWLRRHFVSFNGPDGDDFILRAVISLVFVLLVLLWGVVHVMAATDSIKLFNLRLHGVRGTGTVVSTGSVPLSGGSSAHHTEITFVAGGDRYVEEIDGEYAEGDRIPIVYVADDPSVVDSESHIATLQSGAVTFVVTLLVEIAGVLIWLRKRRSG